MSTTSPQQTQQSLFRKKSNPQEPQVQQIQNPKSPNIGYNFGFFKNKQNNEEPLLHQIQTPESPNIGINIDVKNLQRTETGLIRQFKAFVMGISGGDCAGKKQLINLMFDKVEIKKGDDVYWTWKMPQTGESVAVLHQNYFIQDQNKKYTADGTDWHTFKKKAISLSLGNQITIKLKSGQQNSKKIKIAPAKVICIEGSHIFCQHSEVNDIMNLRVFIDSDSDVRLSRRIYKDSVENGKMLDYSILEYLTQIKPSYEKQIEPTKVNCDLVVPHIGNGYADHKMKDRANADLNIKNITNLLITQIRSAIKIYKDMQEKQKQSENRKNHSSPKKQQYNEDKK